MDEVTLDDVRDIALARRAVREGFGRTLRVAAGVTQREGARILGVSQGALCKWRPECASRAPRSRLATAGCFGSSAMSEPLVFTVKELQRALNVGRHTALRLANDLGIRVSPRRLVVPRVRLEQWLAGERPER